ncbi:hypothetical protein ACVBGC_26870 [Burkholderia stagnalis]
MKNPGSSLIPDANAKQDPIRSIASLPRLRSKIEQSRLHRNVIEVLAFRVPRRRPGAALSPGRPAVARRVETIKDRP